MLADDADIAALDAGSTAVLQLIYYMHQTGDLSLEDAAGAAGDFTMGLMAAIQHPEWALAFCKLADVGGDEDQAQYWCDGLVRAVPVSHVS